MSVAFHEVDLSAWNAALGTAFCLSVILLAESGRWCGGSGARPVPAEGAVVIGLVVCLTFPLVAPTLLAVAAIDVLLIQSVPQLKRAFS